MVGRPRRRSPLPDAMETPHFASSLSTEANSARAEAEAVHDLMERLGDARPDLLAIFATHHHGTALEGLAGRVQERTGARVALGCTGENVIGGTREVEGQPGISLWAAVLPDTAVRPFEVSCVPGPDDRPIFTGGPEIEDPARSSLLLLADPFSFPMHLYLERLNAEHPGVPAVGGMASGGMGPGQNLLLVTDGVREGGAIGVVLEGGIEVRSVVSQGCRPVGKPWVVTDGESNVIKKLGGKSALEALMRTMQEMEEADRQLFQQAPFVGLAIDPSKSEFERGDFLVRGFLGMDPREKTVAVADAVRRGQTIQFLVRDAESAGDDLRQLMRSQGGGELAEGAGRQSAGALLFSCNGRGRRMFPIPDHDIGCVRAGLAADVPVAGFFAAGEIGPVGGRNFLHGFTASVAVFRPRP